MKTRFLILLLLTPLVGLAQQLTLTELISFVKKDIVDVNINLSGKNWVLVQSNMKDEDVQVSWAYNFEKHDSTAFAWLGVTSNKKYFNTVKYQCPNPQVYNEIMKGIMAFNPKDGEVNFNKEDGSIVKTYYGKTYLYEALAVDGNNIITVIDSESQHRRDMDLFEIVNFDNPIKIELLYSTTLREGIRQAVVFRYESGTEPKGIVTSNDKLEIYNRGDDFYWIKFKDSFGYIDKNILKSQ